MTESAKEKPLVAGHKNAKLTPAQWSEAILLWKQGETTYRELSAKYGVSIRRLQEKFEQVKAKKGELIRRQQKAQEEAIVLEPSEMAKRIFDTKNEVYLQLTAIRRMTSKMVIDTIRDGKRVGSIVNDIKAMKEAIQVIEIARSGAYTILGLDKENDKDKELPSLEIRGLTQDEIEDLRAESSEDAAQIMEAMTRASEDDERDALMGEGEDGDTG